MTDLQKYTFAVLAGVLAMPIVYVMMGVDIVSPARRIFKMVKRITWTKEKK